MYPTNANNIIACRSPRSNQTPIVPLRQRILALHKRCSQVGCQQAHSIAWQEYLLNMALSESHPPISSAQCAVQDPFSPLYRHSIHPNPTVLESPVLPVWTKQQNRMILSNQQNGELLLSLQCVPAL